MGSIVAVLVGFFWLSAAVAGTSTSKGAEVPPVPSGCEVKEGMLLDRSGTVGYERLVCSGEGVVLLERLLGYHGKEPFWKVVDEVRLPSLGGDTEVLPVPLCSSVKYKDEAIIVIGKWSRQKDGSLLARDISHAWRFDVETATIEPISVEGVSCEGDNPVDLE